MGEVDWKTAPETRDLWDGSPRQDLETDLKPRDAPREEGDNAEEPGKVLDTGRPELQTREPPLASARVTPVPDSPNLVIRAPPSPSLLVLLPPPVPPFARNWSLL